MDQTIDVSELFGQQPKKPKRILIVAIILILSAGLWSIPIYSNLHITQADKIEVQNCQSFHTQPEAQRFYDLFIKSDNPQLVKMAQKLDRDHDGIPCEHLPFK